jgi:NADH:ubiquinone oxidoreductase subunit 6 (subunit J)
MQLTSQQISFLVLGAITLGGALMVVIQQKALRAALCLALSSLGVAGLYVLLEAFPLAAIHFLIYVGGISTMITFTVILTQNIPNTETSASNRQWWAAALVAMALLGTLGAIILSYSWGLEPGSVPDHGFKTLGATLIAPQGFIVPSAVGLVLLLITLAGAVTIAKEQ